MGKATATKISLRGTNGDDTFRIPTGYSLLTTTFDGGRGYDTIDLSSYQTAGVRIVLTDGYAKSAGSAVYEQAFIGAMFPTYFESGSLRGTIKGVEHLIGSNGNDFLAANVNGAAVTLEGGAGNDALQAYGSITGATLIGGSGSDWFESAYSGSIMVGSTMATLGDGDDATDVFNVTNYNRILDFETSYDKLVLTPDLSNGSPTKAELLSGTWVSDGASGSTYMADGSAVVTLSNVSVSLAETIDIGLRIYGSNGQPLTGGPGDDILECNSSGVDTIAVGAGNGDDLVVNFDLNDILQFGDGLIPTWSDTMVNGENALLASFTGGSLTICGYTTDDVGTLHTTGYDLSLDSFAPAAPGPWSMQGDAALIAAANPVP